MADKQFYSFANGRKFDDRRICEWLENLKSAILHDHKLHWLCSCGDTMVSCHVYDSLIDIAVATSDGYASIKFYSFDELREWHPNFTRTSLKAEKQPMPLLCSCGEHDCLPGRLVCPECAERD